MKGLISVLAACLVPICGVAQEAPQADVPGLAFQQSAGTGSPYRMDSLGNLPRLAWEDAGTLARAPRDWTSCQWTNVALGVAAVVAVGLVLDRSVDEGIVRIHRNSWDQPARNVAQLGGTGGLILIGGGYLASDLLGLDEARSLWADAAIATVLSQVAVFPVKVMVGRDRPGDNQGTSHFNPFGSLDASFPSSHVAQAFALASAVSLHTDSIWASGAAYGLASLVGLSRLETRDHFSSDVVAGALIGTSIGHAVVHINQTRRFGATGHAEISFAPAWGLDFRGVTMVAKF